MKRSDMLMMATAAALGLAALAGTTADAQGRGDRDVMTFSELDTDGSGTLTVEDFEAARAARFAEMDANGDGQVSLDEFQAVAAARASERAAQAFARLDADGDGLLGRDVLEGRAGGPGPWMLERLDADGDGALSEDEFDAARERMAEMRGKRGGGGHGHDGPRPRR